MDLRNHGTQQILKNKLLFTYNIKWNNDATTPTITGLRGGTYTVSVTDANGCLCVASVVVGSTTGTEDFTKTISMSISPMPNSGLFLLKLELPQAQIAQLEVYNLIGQKVEKRLIQGKTIAETVDMTHLPMGRYLIKINTESGVVAKWMVIAK